MRRRMPSSNFCGCKSGFRKSAHVLNKPVGSCYLKYADTRGWFYYYLCWLAQVQSAFQREVHRRGYRDAPYVGEGRPKIECIGVVQFYFRSYFHNTENIRFSQPGIV
jgi:hypothetical protein